MFRVPVFSSKLLRKRLKATLMSLFGAAVFLASHSWAGLNRVQPGTSAARLMLRHFGCRGSFWNSLKLSKNLFTKRDIFL